MDPKSQQNLFNSNYRVLRLHSIGCCSLVINMKLITPLNVTRVCVFMVKVECHTQEYANDEAY